MKKLLSVLYVILMICIFVPACGGSDSENECVDYSYYCSTQSLSYQCYDGKWNIGTYCGYGCNYSTGQCNKCETGTFSCSSDSSYECIDGELNYIEYCSYGCNYSIGKCYTDSGDTGEEDTFCDDGDYGCDGATSYKCSGNAWIVDEYCGSSGCNTSTGQCNECTPACSGKECGNDGCDGSCGTCDSGYDCTVSGQCVRNNSCTTSEDCDDSLFCYQNTCQTPWNKNWKVTFISAQVSEKNPDGESWDELGGLPDIFAKLMLGESTVFVTNTVDNSTSATWNYSQTVLFGSSTDAIYFCLFDEDISVHDRIVCVHSNDQMYWFREQDIALTADDFSEDNGLESFKFSLKPAW